MRWIAEQMARKGGKKEKKCKTTMHKGPLGPAKPVYGPAGGALPAGILSHEAGIDAWKLAFPMKRGSCRMQRD